MRTSSWSDEERSGKGVAVAEGSVFRRRVMAHYVTILVISAAAALWPSGANGAEVEAASGRPFGVARIMIPLTDADASLAIETNGFELEAPPGRVFYPTYAQRRVLGLLQDLLGVRATERTGSVTAYFLFRGEDPFSVTVRTPEPRTFVVAPQRRPALWRNLRRQWWDQYTATARLQERDGDYPPIIEKYLTSMLGARLDLRSPLPPAPRRSSQEQESLLLVLNVESMRLRALDQTLAAERIAVPASEPVPPPIAWNELPLPPPATEVELEPIAHRVPEECMYLRFGSFNNYLWTRKFLEQNGGRTSQLVTLRGHDAMLNQRTQEQLGLKESALAELLGNQLISDVALIGRDTYMREGAAIGILFEARNLALLQNELTKQRRSAVAEQKAAGAEFTELTIDDTPVSHASTPDNRLRSFQVNVKNYLLVTNSRALAERFLRLESEGGSLASSTTFQHARAEYPIDPDASLFAYLSPAFFRGLVSPQYQIELRRRLQAVTDLELVELARLVAVHEGLPHGSVEALIRSDLLPPNFLARADGSRAELVGDVARDSLRGARGSFLPIPDVPLQAVTPEEATRYATIARFHESRWREMDPLVVQVRRETMEQGERERITIDAQMLPFNREKYGRFLSAIGPPSTTVIRQPAGDAITAQVILQGGLLRPNVQPHHVFFGIQDQEIPIEFSNRSFMRVLQILRSAPAYLGAWPELGLLNMLPLIPRPHPQDPRLSELPFGLWRYQSENGFALIGVEPRILAETSGQLEVAQAETEAQIRVHVADVSESKIKTWFAALDFQRAYQTSLGNTHLLHAFGEQLGVAEQNALEAAESVLGVDLVCPLGGDYQLYESKFGETYWGSTHWPEHRREAAEPGEFASPSLAWFRGLDAEVTVEEDRVTAHAVLEVKPLEQGKPKLPFFNFFNR